MPDLRGTAESFESELADALPIELAQRLPVAIQELDEALLADAERERRLRAMWFRSDLQGADYNAIALAAAGVANPLLRNAVSALLPAPFRRQIFSVRSAVVVIDKDIEATNPLPPGSLEEAASFADVLALTTEDDGATRRLLSDSGFVYHRSESIEGFSEMLRLNREICAVIVDASSLAALNESEQRKLFADISGYSSFALIKLDDSGLKITNTEVMKIVREGRCSLREPDALRLVIRAGSGLKQRELEQLRTIQRSLSVGSGAGLYVPGEVTEDELRLLAASLFAFAQSRRFKGSFELESIRTDFLQGGLSGAKVAVVRINDSRIPVVVKISDKQAILNEARRFYTYILAGNDDLTPEVHFHGSNALIIFGIIADSEVSDTVEPAPTLNSRLRQLWLREMSLQLNTAEHEDVYAGFAQAVERLKLLNIKVPEETHDPSFANPHLKTIKELEKSGLSLGYSVAEIAARSTAEDLFEPNKRRSTCHGDSHTGNVLIRRDQGFLIDYAYSGPGHPGVDLARLELSVFSSAIHPFGQSTSWVSLQRALSFDLSSLDELCVKFADLMISKTNVLALRMCVRARDACLRVLEAHGLDASHYRAAKLLLSWQASIKLSVPTSFSARYNRRAK